MKPREVFKQNSYRRISRLFIQSSGTSDTLYGLYVVGIHLLTLCLRNEPLANANQINTSHLQLNAGETRMHNCILGNGGNTSLKFRNSIQLNVKGSVLLTYIDKFHRITYSKIIL